MFYFSACPGETLTILDHSHVSKTSTASLPIQELVLPGQSSHDVGAVVLVTLLKGNISLTWQRSDIHEHQGKASGLCPAAVTAGGFPFPISLFSFSNVKVDGKSTHTICSSSLLFCLLLQFSFTFSCPAPRAQSAARNQAWRTFPSVNNQGSPLEMLQHSWERKEQISQLWVKG